MDFLTPANRADMAMRSKARWERRPKPNMTFCGEDTGTSVGIRGINYQASGARDESWKCNGLGERRRTADVYGIGKEVR